MFLKTVKKEPWQIAAARYCVEHSETGFTQRGLFENIKLNYHVTVQQLNQFYDEEIRKPAGREHDRVFIKTEEGGVWVPPLDLVAKITDYDELQEARESSRHAMRMAMWSLWIAIIVGVLQILIPFYR